MPRHHHARYVKGNPIDLCACGKDKQTTAKECRSCYLKHPAARLIFRRRTVKPRAPKHNLCHCGKLKCIASRECRSCRQAVSHRNFSYCHCGRVKTSKSRECLECARVRVRVPKEFDRFREAKRRCTDPHRRDYVRYGGRGVQWKFSSWAEAFAELGPCPAGKTLDRIDNDGHYEPGNVRWATPYEQRNNTRGRRMFGLGRRPRLASRKS